MKHIQEAIDAVSYLYPTRTYPEQKSEWDIGHKCMAYFEQQLPLSRILLPWYLLQKLYQQYCQIPTQIIQTPQSIRNISKAIALASNQLQQLRREKKNNITTPNLIKKYKAANCQELSEIAYRWMTKHGRTCYCVECSFVDNKGTDLNCSHILLLYRKDNKNESFRNLIKNLNSPNVQALDMLFGRCGQAYDVLNALSMESVCMTNEEKSRPLRRGDALHIWNQNLAQEANLEHLNVYNIGSIGNGLFKKKKLNLYSTPKNVALDNDTINLFVEKFITSMERE